MITLSSISVDCSLRVVNTGTSAETDVMLDCSKTGQMTVPVGFCNTFFYEVANGRKKGNIGGSFATVLKSQTWNGTAFVTGNKIITNQGLTNKYQTETTNVFEIGMEKLYDGEGGNQHCGSTQTGYYTNLEIYFIPDGINIIDAETDGYLILSSDALQKAVKSELIQIGQTLKGIPIQYGNGTTDEAKIFVNLKFIMLS